MSDGRPRVRKQFYLYHSNLTLGWRLIHNVSFAQGERKVAMGVWRRVNDEAGNHIGYQILAAAAHRVDLDVASRPQPVSITMRQMEVNTWKSRTEKLSEEQRMERVARGLPAEDEAERVQMKVAVWPFMGSKQGDICRAWDAAMAAAR